MEKKKVAVISIIAVVLIGAIIAAIAFWPDSSDSTEEDVTTRREMPSTPELTVEEEMARSNEMMAAKKLAMKELMTDVQETVSVGNCVVTLEKQYYSINTGDGYFLISMKLTDGSSIEENLNISQGAREIYFGETWEYYDHELESTEQIPRYMIYNETGIDESYVENNTLYIYIYKETYGYYGFGSDEDYEYLLVLCDTKVMEGAEEEDDIMSAMAPLAVSGDSRSSKLFKIRTNVEINISAASLMMRDTMGTRNLSIVFKDGSEMGIVIEKKVDFYTLVDHVDESDSGRKYTFNQMIDIEQIEYILLNDEEYYPE